MKHRIIPIVGTYRGIGIHADQPEDRIESKVKPAIDAVYLIDDEKELFSYAGDITRPPEARLFAAAKCRAAYQAAADERRSRPEIELPDLGAQTAGLNSAYLRDRFHYCSVLDACRRSPGPNALQPDKREVPLDT